MNSTVKNLKLLSEEELVRYLYKIRNGQFTSEVIDYSVLITRAFYSKSKDFQNHVCKFITHSPSLCITELVSWINLNYREDFISIPEVKIHNLNMIKPSNFIERTIISLGYNNLDGIFKLLEIENYYVYLTGLRSITIILYRDMSSMFKGTFEKYLYSIIDFCVSHYDEYLVKFYVCLFISFTNDENSKALLHYVKDNEKDFTLKFISILGLDNLERINRCKPNKNNTEIYNSIMSYRR